MSKYKVIDSHVHLCPLSNIHYLDIPKDSILYRNHTLNEYFEYNTFPQHDKQGVVLIEMNVKSSIDEPGWANPIEEFNYHSKLLAHYHAPQDCTSHPGLYIKGIIPWAPIPLGYDQVGKYVTQLQDLAVGDSFSKVKGFRYLLQDKPLGTMLKPDFIEGMRYLAEHDYVFDLGIDLQDGGLYQFSESFKLLCQFPNMTFIINHLSKPDFYLDRPNEIFNEWEYHMNRIAQLGNSYIKLSGCFEELPPDFVAEASLKDITKKLNQWFKVILKAFGTKRILFGSNWPMDNTNGDHYDPDGYNKWGLVIETLLDEFHIPISLRQDIFYNNCIALYHI